MPMITAPYVETQQVVTGFMYQLHIAEEANGPGITRLDIGPYFFGGAAGRVTYPEAVTNEMTPPGWQAIRWYTDEAGASWLRWEGGRLNSEDGEMLFQVTSNYPPSNYRRGPVCLARQPRPGAVRHFRPGLFVRAAREQSPPRCQRPGRVRPGQRLRPGRWLWR